MRNCRIFDHLTGVTGCPVSDEDTETVYEGEGILRVLFSPRASSANKTRTLC